MKTLAIVPLWAALVLPFAPIVVAAEEVRAVDPSESELVEVLEDWIEQGARRLGHDASGGWYAWMDRPPKVLAWDPETGRRWSVSSAGAVGVDADLRWGVLVIGDFGSTLRHLAWNGEVRKQIPLENIAGAVQWLDERRVAVAPQVSAARVEIWDLQTGSRMRTLGTEEPVPDEPGARFARGIRFAHPPDSAHLFALDSRTGSLQRFDLESGGTASYTIDNPHSAEHDEWMAQVDAEMRSKNESLNMMLMQLDLAVTAQGRVLSSLGCSDREETARLVTWEAGRERESVDIATSCCSSQFVARGEKLFFYRTQGKDRPPCVDRVALSSSPVETSWIEGFPLHSDEAPVRVEDGSGEALALETGRWLICHGAAEPIGTHCEVVLLDQPIRWQRKDEPQPGARLTGRVTFGREPVAKAAVLVFPAGLRTRRQEVFLPLSWPEGEDEPVRLIETDRDGSFTLPPIAPGTYRLEIRYPGSRRLKTDPISVPPAYELLARDDDPWKVSAFLDLGELSIDPGLTSEVRVTDSAGNLLPGAQVAAGQGDRPEDLTLYEARADAEGIARVRGLLPDSSVRMRCSLAGYVAVRGTFEVPPTATSCELTEMSAVRGHVLDEQEEPVPGATARIGDRYGPVTTDDEGAFELEGLSPGPVTLTLSAPGHRVEERQVETRAGKTAELEPVILRPGEVLTGRVVDAATKEPVPGAQVAVVDPEPGTSARTDEDGAFSLEHDPDRPTRLEVRADGYAVHRTDVTEAPEGEVVVEIAPGGRLHIVTASTTSADAPPCRGCAYSVQGAGGLFEMRTDTRGEAWSEPLAPGRYGVGPVREQGLGSMVTVSGGDEHRWAEVRSGEITVVRFEERERSVAILLSAPPPPGSRLRAQGTTEERSADVTGDAVRLDLPPGAVGFWLDRRGNAVRVGEIPADFDRDELRLDLPRGGVTGSLVDDDGPAAHRLFRLLDPRGQTAASFRTEADGAFHLSHLPPAVYTIEPVGSGGSIHTFASEPDGITDLGAVLLP